MTLSTAGMRTILLFVTFTAGLSSPLTVFARPCAASHLVATQPVDHDFKPNHHLAQVRTLQGHVPEVRNLDVVLRLRDFDGYIKDLGRRLKGRMTEPTARSELLYFMRFGSSLKIRREAFFELASDSQFKHHVDQLIAAELHERDPAFQALLKSTIEKIIPEHEAYRKAHWQKLPREWLDDMTHLSNAEREILWRSIQRGYSYRNPIEIQARIEQIPAEIEWLEGLRTQALKSSRMQAIYEAAIHKVKKRRMELADQLFDDMIMERYRHRDVDFLIVSPTSEKLNSEKFPNYHPPFTPDRPHLLVRVRPGKSIDLTRTYGGKASVGGAFFFPDRPVYMKSSAEARDTGALPDANTTEFWRKVTFGEGEEFYLGAINPQISLSGQKIPNFGRGGLGGDIQFWREPVIRKEGQEIKKPYFTQEQMGVEVPTIQAPELQRAQSLLRAPVDRSDSNWHEAKRIFERVSKGASSSDLVLQADLRKMEAELWRFHYLNYIRQLNGVLTLLPLKSYERGDFERKLADVSSDFSRRDMEEFSFLPRTKGWIESNKYQHQVHVLFRAKVQAYYEKKENPQPIKAPPIPQKPEPRQMMSPDDYKALNDIIKYERY